MLATIRNRRGLIATVEPFDSPEGRLHLVRVEYTDSDGVAEDTVLWEREHGRDLLEPNALPQVQSEASMEPREFEALVRAARWAALTPFLHPDGSGRAPDAPISAPFFGAVQVDDFQLVPLLKALEMPRVSLLLADDVGLGKTIEAGLILTELLIRRRVRWVLILTPASLTQQWQREMKTKFSLNFDLIDRTETHAVQRRLGLDANPWRTFPRIIASYYYLRQPDILQQFLATCRMPEPASGGPRAQLPWDLLIVDEAHNLLPSPFGEDNQLVKALREITPLFEHKLFLTATPHNGHTRSFSGLLEVLDPVRFTQTSEFTDKEKERVQQVVVRRLKSEINELDTKHNRPNRFPQRHLDSKQLFLTKEERALSLAVEEFRKAVKKKIAASQKSEQLAGSFAIEILSKRLLSSPFTFAESWYRFLDGAHGDVADATAVRAAQRSLEEDLDDDGEIESRTHHAARTVGAWLKPLLPDLTNEVAAIDHALDRLGLTRNDGALRVPKADSRFDRLLEVVTQHVRDGKQWKPDERLIIFTEYKTTLDYLFLRFKTEFHGDYESRIRILFGGKSQAGLMNRDEVIAAFNDPDDPIRILIATDVASEGLNLQESARLVFHFDIPWNPSRLEQRNGRLDRHGQARDVTVFHFTSEDDADLKFVGKVVQKVHEIREDLGSMGQVFDAAFERRFQDQEDTDPLIEHLDHDVKKAKGRAIVPHNSNETNGEEYAKHLVEFARHIDLSPETLKQTLEVAMASGGSGYPRLEGPDAKGRMRLATPIPPRWQSLIDETLRLERKGASIGALPAIVFDPAFFLDASKGRAVFRAKPDTVLLHLGHPVFHHALSTLARLRFPGSGRKQRDHSASRWTVRTAELPKDVDALILLTVEELAVNELREPFHHWTRTYQIPVRQGDLGDPLPYQEPTADRACAHVTDAALVQGARHIWEDAEPDLRSFVQSREASLTEALKKRLEAVGVDAIKAEQERFRLRLKEVERAMSENTIAKLEKERDRLIADMRQLTLIDIDRRVQEDRLRDLEAELQRRSSHFNELLTRLKAEQDRILSLVLPKRYQLRQSAQVFPVAVEIRLPGIAR
jgi:superfamily II DNA or RNA helicase